MPKRSPLKLRRYQFTLAGKRRNVSLGQLPDYLFTEYVKHLDELVIAKRLAILPTESTNRWLAEIADGLHVKIAAVGLCEGRNDALLGVLLAEYIASYGGSKKPTTIARWQLDAGRIIGFFGEACNVKTITSADCEHFKQHLYSDKSYAHSTVGKVIKTARQFFADFQKRGILSNNPFVGVKTSSATQDYRTVYVPCETIETIINVTPNAERRAILALARFAGLRPSEILELRIADVKWDRGLIVVRSQKTEHHAGGGSREVPIFRELRPYLVAVCEQQDAGAVYILDRLRNRSSALKRNHKPNLGDIVGELCGKAGVTLWTKPFVSLRASCATDLAERFPLQATTAWLGHSVAIANKHYLRVRAEHVARAVNDGISNTSLHQKTGDQAGANFGATREKTERASDKGKTDTPENKALETIPHKEKQDKHRQIVPSGRPILERTDNRLFSIHPAIRLIPN